MRFSFPATERTVADVIRVEGLKKAYGEHVVFPGIDLTVRRGEKIGIIGVNGAGKTTLLRMIAGELPHDGGTIKIGSGVKVGYYAQHHADTLDMTATRVRDRAARGAGHAARARALDPRRVHVLRATTSTSRSKVLSGGERARVALARLLVKPGNLLLMDEPTNHLDLASSESLARVAADVRRHAGVRQPQPQPDPRARDADLERRGPAGRDLPGHARRVPVLDGRSAARRSRPRATRPPGATRAAPRRRRRWSRRPRRTTRRASAARPRPARSAARSSGRSRSRSRSSRSGSACSRPSRRRARPSSRIPSVYDDAARRNKLLCGLPGAADKLEELTARWETGDGRARGRARRAGATAN